MRADFARQCWSDTPKNTSRCPDLFKGCTSIWRSRNTTLSTRKNMTALNWEASKRSTKRSDYSGDDLPRTGSWADQKRYASLPFRSTHKAYAPSCAVIQSRASDFQKMHLYASHAMSPDFRRKSVVMQREIVGIVTRLHVQCLSWAGAQSPTEVAAMKMAIVVMKNQVGSV